MNKLGIFSVTFVLVCLLFVDFAASIRATERLNARLAVRRNHLRVDPEAGQQPKADQLKNKANGAVASLNAAEANLEKAVKDVTEKKRQAIVEKVRQDVASQIENLKKQREDRTQALHAIRAAEKVLSDPDTLKEIQETLQKRIHQEVNRSLHEESVREQISKELEEELRYESEKAHNATLGAQASAAKAIVAALNAASNSVAKAETEEQNATRDLKENVNKAIVKAKEKYESAFPTPVNLARAPAPAAAAPAPATPAGLIQMTNTKKLKQMLKNRKDDDYSSELAQAASQAASSPIPAQSQSQSKPQAQSQAQAQGGAASQQASSPQGGASSQQASSPQGGASQQASRSGEQQNVLLQTHQSLSSLQKLNTKLLKQQLQQQKAPKLA